MASKHKHHDDQDDEVIGPHRTLAPPSSDMNVTPLIDVLLVLLVIFMATLPFSQKGLDVNLPLEVHPVQQPKVPDAQIIVEYGADRQLRLNKQAVQLADLQPRLRNLLDGRTEKTVFIIGAPTVKYGEITPLIDAGIGAGGRVAIVTEGMKKEGLAGR